MDKMDDTLENVTYSNKFPLLYKKIQDKIKIMHNLGIIHRDLKLDNIMFKGNDVFIIDFGLSFVVDDKDEYEDLFGDDYIDNFPQINFYINGKKCNDWA